MCNFHLPDSPTQVDIVDFVDDLIRMSPKFKVEDFSNELTSDLKSLAQSIQRAALEAASKSWSNEHVYGAIKSELAMYEAVVLSALRDRYRFATKATRIPATVGTFTD